MISEASATGRKSGRVQAAISAGLLVVALVWASWPALRAMAERWSTDPRYAHGYLVPLFSAYLLWHRQAMIASLAWTPSWWGVIPIAIGSALQLAGGYIFFGWFEAVAILPLAAGIALIAGGWRSLRWSWPSIAFLAFMLPLPFRLEVALGGPLQRVATLISTFSLQTLGFAAVPEGNVIHLDGGPIEIVEACGGLGMIFTFVAMAAGVAILGQRPWADRLLILLSAIPIALTANVTRITATGVMHEMVSSRAANVLFHDLAGWLMMPLALGLMALEIAVLDRLFPSSGDRLNVAAAGTPGRRRGEGGYQPQVLTSTEEVVKQALKARSR
jgi:exosortase